MKEKLLSIIVPVYNVEAYIHACLTSLLQQGLDESSYEIILIDDSTPDRSIEVIADLLQAHPNIQVIRQRNQGPSAARNLGMRKATGKYILYVDSDDLLVENSLRTLLDIAIGEQADLVVADYIYHQVEEDETPVNIQPCDQPALTVKTGHELFLDDLNPDECFIWRTLYRKDYLNEKGLSFIEGIIFEDVPYLQECYLNADKCVRVSYPFYIYQRRHGTLSSAIQAKSLFDMNLSMQKVWELSCRDSYPPVIRERLRDNLFHIFSKALWYISNNKQLLAQRKDFVDDLKTKIPDLAFHHGMKQKVVSWFFHVMPCTYLKLRAMS